MTWRAGLIAVTAAVAGLPPLPKIAPLPPHLAASGLTVEAQTAVDLQPGSPAFGFGSVWVPSSATGIVDRVDPKTLEVTARIGGGRPRTVAQNQYYDSVAVSPTAVWRASDVGNEVARIDPKTNRLVAVIAVPGRPDEVAAGPNGVYVSLFQQTLVLRIDPRRNRVDRQRDIGGNAMGVAFANDTVWALSTTGPSVVRLDPTTLKILGRTSIASKAPPGTGYFDAWWIAGGSGSVCAGNQQQNLVTRIDPRTAHVTAQTKLGFGSNPFGVAADGAGCWAASATGVFRTGAKAASSHLPPPGPSQFVGVAVGGGAAWVTAAGRNALYRVR